MFASSEEVQNRQTLTAETNIATKPKKNCNTYKKSLYQQNLTRQNSAYCTVTLRRYL